MINNFIIASALRFISVSDWDAKGVMGQVAEETEKTFSGREQAKGLLVDESSWLKKGKKSVGVAKQYLSSVGKIDNGQVVVFAAMAQANQVALVDVAGTRRNYIFPKSGLRMSSECSRPEFLKNAGSIKQRLSWLYRW